MTALLYRPQLGEPPEREAAETIWGDDFYEYRSQIPRGEDVVARYAVWPFYEEVYDELSMRDCELTHTPSFHEMIADMKWYNHLEDMTPTTWFDEGYATVPDTPHGYVLKGRTNSRKFQWNSMMYAEDRDDLKKTYRRLNHDGQISDQGIVIREYVPLDVLETGINGVPFANEWRFFFRGTELLCSGYYWACASVADQMTEVPGEAKKLAEEAARILTGTYDEPGFMVVDVAKTKFDNWIVIEINDGQMSGLSMIDAEDFYEILHETY